MGFPGKWKKPHLWKKPQTSGTHLVFNQTRLKRTPMDLGQVPCPVKTLISMALSRKETSGFPGVRQTTLMILDVGVAAHLALHVKSWFLVLKWCAESDAKDVYSVGHPYTKFTYPYLPVMSIYSLAEWIGRKKSRLWVCHQPK